MTAAMLATTTMASTTGVAASSYMAAPGVPAANVAMSAAVIATTAISTATVTASAITTAWYIASAATANEAMATPAMPIAPVSPWAYTQKDSVIEVARPVKTYRRTGIGGIFIVAIGTDRWRSTDAYNDLCLTCRHKSHRCK
jgi:hypothetical protein